MIFRRLSVYLAAAGIAAAILLVRRMQQKPPAPAPVAAPARSPYLGTVAATGLIEAARENVRIAAPKGGLVTRVLVKVGDAVREGDPLFQLDAREAASRVETVQAQLEAMRATLKAEEVALADTEDQLARFEKLRKDSVATEEELKRRWFAAEGARARIGSIRAQIHSVERQWQQAKTDLEILTVKAPRDGELLQVNLRAGEYAPAAALAEPLMLLGDVAKLQVRADVDEQNSVLVEPQAEAVASLKGHADLRMPLRFVRVEPYVVPKRSLTGDSLERVDTRVLQIIYEFDRPSFPVYVGQQVDVFIRRGNPKAPVSEPTSVPVAGRR
ncbi:MAG: efflux RND transporter periplasmic adaptor subunit [Verrucomicrobiales bacterium]|nr:efflux RND transporter periplasmic adaptor subunit [Verrucomicrobiales bacterium]